VFKTCLVARRLSRIGARQLSGRGEADGALQTGALNHQEGVHEAGAYDGAMKELADCLPALIDQLITFDAGSWLQVGPFSRLRCR
jgi:hypothetical protein